MIVTNLVPSIKGVIIRFGDVLDLDFNFEVKTSKSRYDLYRMKDDVVIESSQVIKDIPKMSIMDIKGYVSKFNKCISENASFSEAKIINK